MATPSMKRIRTTAAVAAIASLFGFACDEPVAPERDTSEPRPQFEVADEEPLRMTGGGRIDFPDGGTEKNTPESRTFQTYGLTVRDQDGDGAPDGEFQFVDHSPEHRLNDRPLNLHSLSWTTLEPTADDCEDGGVAATGTLEVRNTGERHEFRLQACDDGEPGRSDQLTLKVFRADGTVRWSWDGLLTGGNLQAHFSTGDGDGSTSPTTGDLDVATATDGSDIDADGYTAVVDGTEGQAIGVNDTVRFADLAEGDHTVELTGVASNCDVSGSNPRTVTVTAGEVASTAFSVSCTATGGTATMRITGLGALGTGEATPGSSRQDFDFEATDAPGGYLNYTDWGVVRPDGSAATITVDPASDPETAITSFTRSTEDPACVTFGGTARLDTGELVDFSVDACDYGSPGAGLDLFAIAVPSHGYERRDRLSEGEITLETSS